MFARPLRALALSSSVLLVLALPSASYAGRVKGGDPVGDVVGFSVTYDNFGNASGQTGPTAAPAHTAGDITWSQVTYAPRKIYVAVRMRSFPRSSSLDPLTGPAGARSATPPRAALAAGPTPSALWSLARDGRRDTAGTSTFDFRYVVFMATAPGHRRLEMFAMRGPGGRLQLQALNGRGWLCHGVRGSFDARTSTVRMSAPARCFGTPNRFRAQMETIDTHAVVTDAGATIDTFVDTPYGTVTNLDQAPDSSRWIQRTR